MSNEAQDIINQLRVIESSEQDGYVLDGEQCVLLVEEYDRLNKRIEYLESVIEGR
jgi:hypothetical protein